jgi:hypothetical protein
VIFCERKQGCNGCFFRRIAYYAKGFYVQRLGQDWRGLERKGSERNGEVIKTSGGKEK